MELDVKCLVMLQELSVDELKTRLCSTKIEEAASKLYQDAGSGKVKHSNKPWAKSHTTWKGRRPRSRMSPTKLTNERDTAACLLSLQDANTKKSSTDPPSPASHSQYDAQEPDSNGR